MPLKLPRHVHRKRAKGRSYYYFDTGTKNANGKPALVRLPDYASNGFGRAYAALLEKRQNKPPPESELTLTALSHQFQRSPDFRNKAENTQVSYLNYLGKIVDLMGASIASEVERRDVVALRDHLAEKPGAANQAVKTMSLLYKWAINAGILTGNPCTKVPLFEGGEHEPWPEWLLDAALNADDEKVKLYTSLLYYTGQRIGDVCKMKWSDIQADGTIYVLTQKRKTKNFIPIHSQLAAMLKATPRGLGTIIMGATGKPVSRMTVLNTLQAFATERDMKIVAHGLRKNAVNALLEAGCSVAETAAITDQSIQIVEYYAKKRNKAKLAKSAMDRWDGSRT